MQRGNKTHNNAITKKSNFILAWELGKDLISFSHCWSQQILLSRQWEAKSHEVWWILQFPIWIGKGIYRGTACKLLGKTRHVRLLSIFGWSETKLPLYQKVIISFNWIFPFSINTVLELDVFLVLSRSDHSRVQWNWLFHAGQSGMGHLGESFKNLFP